MIPDEFTRPVALATDVALELLTEGELEIEGKVLPAVQMLESRAAG